jgi:tetratricopeptide (TPR) repeat protein
LRRLIEEEPRASHWRLMLARMDLDEGHIDDAIRNASVVLQYDQGNQDALLIRGLAMAEQRRWDAAVMDLAASGKAGHDERRAEALLRGYVELGRWQEASSFIASLPGDVRNASSIQGLVQSVEKNWRQEEADPSSARGENSVTPSAVLSSEETEELQRARAILDESVDREDLLTAYQLAREVADKRPDVARAQHLAGEAAYRLARWTDAVAYFRRGGRPPESQPVTSFYMAVALYESGEMEEAAEILRSCVEKLQRTSFVEGYIEKILGTGPSE